MSFLDSEVFRRGFESRLEAWGKPREEEIVIQVEPSLPTNLMDEVESVLEDKLDSRSNWYQPSHRFHFDRFGRKSLNLEYNFFGRVDSGVVSFRYFHTVSDDLVINIENAEVGDIRFSTYIEGDRRYYVESPVFIQITESLKPFHSALGSTVVRLAIFQGCKELFSQEFSDRFYCRIKLFLSLCDGVLNLSEGSVGDVGMAAGNGLVKGVVESGSDIMYYVSDYQTPSWAREIFYDLDNNSESDVFCVPIPMISFGNDFVEWVFPEFSNRLLKLEDMGISALELSVEAAKHFDSPINQSSAGYTGVAEIIGDASDIPVSPIAGVSEADSSGAQS